MEFVVIGLVILCAACLQGAIGFGLGMIAAPILVVLRPELIPSTLLLLAVVTSLTAFIRERSDVDWKLVLWAAAGRIPGIAIGTVAVVMLPETGLSLLLAITVLAGVTFSLVGWTPTPKSGNVVLASAVSGIFGTATSIGGPPMALVLRTLSPSSMRTTMSAYFVLGSLMSLTGLALGGELRAEHVVSAATLAPFMLVGLALSSLVIRRANSRSLYVTAVCASVFGSLLVITDGLVGLVPG